MCPPLRSAALGGSSSRDQPLPLGEDAAGVVDAFYRFTRPHTMLGTAVSVMSVSSLALQGLPWGPAAARGLAYALGAALLMNISIVGINQVFDVDIDKVNKPYLPLASGEFSVATGIAICVATALGSLAVGAASGSPPLMWTLVISLVLGIVYSTDLPFMRWKRFPVLAAGCILAVRCVLVQLGFYYHMKLAVGSAQITLTRPLLFAMAFMLFFSVVIALFKDIPDVKGDDQAGMRTFSVRFGVSRVYWTCIGLLLAAYAGGAVFGLTAPVGWSKVVVTGGHAVMAAILWTLAKRVDLGRKQDITGMYMKVWALFYSEYLLLPFFR